MKSKLQKKEELKTLVGKLPKSSIIVITSFARTGEKGLTVAKMSELKRLLKSANSEYVVIKKTLMDLAFKKLNYDGVDIFGSEGSLGLVVSTEDAYDISKKIYEFAKKNPELQFFGAFVGNEFVSKESFLEMAKMPSRETLLARLFGMMKYPISGLVIVLDQISKSMPAVVEETVATDANPAPVAN